MCFAHSLFNVCLNCKSHGCTPVGALFESPALQSWGSNKCPAPRATSQDGAKQRRLKRGRCSGDGAVAADAEVFESSLARPAEIAIAPTVPVSIVHDANGRRLQHMIIAIGQVDCSSSGIYQVGRLQGAGDAGEPQASTP